MTLYIGDNWTKRPTNAMVLIGIDISVGENSKPPCARLEERYSGIAVW